MGTSSGKGAVLVTPRSNSRRVYTLFLLFVLFTLFYYFGELVDFFGWEALRWDFFYTVHDIHRLFFLVPIIYAGYFFGVRAAIIFTILTLATFLFRALFISPFPDPLLRTVLFIIIAGSIGYLTGNESECRRRLEALVKSQSNIMLLLLERAEEGAIVIGPDYRIRSMNATMRGRFGEGVGSYCYKYLYQFDKPCHQICRLSDVIAGATDKREDKLRDGRTYKVMASPYVDSDGTVCQLAIFTETTRHRKVETKPVVQPNEI